MRVEDRVHLALRRFGVDVIRYPGRGTAIGRRLRLLRHFGITVVLDVGANDGGYARELRRAGYQGQIVSFEPLPDAFAALSALAANDERWQVLNVALGEARRPATLHVAANSVSSSMLRVLPRHLSAAPDSRYVRDVDVELRPLDDVFTDLVDVGDRPFLKIDAQGYEGRILDGAASVLPRVHGVQLELSTVPLYGDAPTLCELVGRLESAGFALMGVEPGFSDPGNGRMLQLDGLFFREDAAP